MERGQRVTELMKQKQYAPMTVAEMAVSLFAVDRGYLDDVELAKIGDFETALLSYMSADHADLMKKVTDTGDYDDAIEEAFKKALEDFKANHAW